MSLAADTRAAVRERPFLLDALRAGVVNYAAAARELDVSDDTDAVATALRRFADDLPGLERPERSVRVRMESGLEPADRGLLVVGDHGFALADGPLTAIVATGAVDARGLERALGTLRTHDIDVRAAGFADEALVVVVERRAGADGLRRVEAALSRE